jgi:integrase
MASKLTLKQACEGMIHYKTAAGKSPHTILDYRNTFKKLLLYFPKNPPLASLTRADLIAFFAWLQEGFEAEPDGAAPRGKFRLSVKSVLNMHTNLSALWTWAVNEGLVEKNIIRTIDPPPVAEPNMVPLTKEDVASLLKACDVSRTWKTRVGKTSTRPNANRDRAIFLTLLDTGMRSGELCGIRFADINFTNNSIEVSGKGPRGGKKRTVYFGKRVAQALWRYLQPRLETIRPEDRVFTLVKGVYENNMTRDRLLKIVKRIGEQAGVADVHPHRFRHTFGRPFGRLITAS